MSKKTVVIVVAVGAAAAFGGYWYAMHRMHAAPAPVAAAQGERKVLYWYDPMYPQHKFDKPGKSPFMDMQLVPKYADESSADAGTVAISPQVVQNLGVRTAKAESGTLERRFEAVGAVAFNERGVVQLQARAAGFVERLHARAPLDPIKKGAALVEILYPEWAGAQEEFLLLARNGSPLAQAARQRLALLGMGEAEIAAIEREGKPRARFTLRAPIGGVIAELGVREGATVSAGMTLFRIVDLSTVWVVAEVPEAQAAWVRPGAKVTARVAAYPERAFEGRVGALLPEVAAATRTVRTRIELANPEALLKPGMYATIAFEERAPGESVLVPSAAVIRTGTRDVVILALGEGRFRAAPVELGAESLGRSEIRKGVQAGDTVVLSGQFLIDSEASLTATLARLESVQDVHQGRGTILELDVEKGRVELDHEPIASMRWPRMTMGFVVEDKAGLGALQKGDTVDFELKAKPDAEGNYRITRIAKKP